MPHRKATGTGIVVVTDWSLGLVTEELDQSDIAMDEAQTPIHLDDAERDRVRRTLRRYMEESRIGTPTLQVRIIDADTPRHREIPLSTLQRFLRGSHQTSDHHVSLCRDFVKDLPYFGEGKDIALFGAAASVFLQAPIEADDRATLMELLKSELAGSYETFTRPQDFAGGLPFPPEENYRRSEISFEQAGDGLWLDVREVQSGKRTERHPDIDDTTRETRFLHDGVAFYAPPQIHVFLRDVLTRQPKIYTLGKRVAENEVNHQVFEGHGYRTMLQPGAPESWTDYFRVQLVRNGNLDETS